MTCETVQRATHPLHRRGKRCLHHSPRLQPVNGVARICGDFHLPFGRSSLPLLSRSVVNIRQSTAVDVRGPPWARAPGRRGGVGGGRAVGGLGGAGRRGRKLRRPGVQPREIGHGNRAKLDTRHESDHGHPLRDGRGAFGWLSGQARARALDFFLDIVESMTLGAGVSGGGAAILPMASASARRTAWCVTPRARAMPVTVTPRTIMPTTSASACDSMAARMRAATSARASA